MVLGRLGAEYIAVVIMKNLVLVICFVALPLFAQDTPDAKHEFAVVLPSPDIPNALESGQPMEPRVTIIRDEDSVTEEYRINGNLYMIKVTPDGGIAYHLIDIDGDGRMESKTTRLGSETVVPQWVLFSW